MIDLWGCPIADLGVWFADWRTALVLALTLMVVRRLRAVRADDRWLPTEEEAKTAASVAGSIWAPLVVLLATVGALDVNQLNAQVPFIAMAMMAHLVGAANDAVRFTRRADRSIGGPPENPSLQRISEDADAPPSPATSSAEGGERGTPAA